MPSRGTAWGWPAAALGLIVAAGAAVPALSPAAAAGGPAPPVERYRAPTATVVPVVRPFAGPPQPWAPGHRGVDLDLGLGAAVLTPAAGTVAVAGVVVDRGVVTVVHADGRRSSLEPVIPSVVVGQELAAGDMVGTVSADRSHCVQACLHWGVRDGSDYVDPLTLLPGGGPVVLLPAEQ
ncbi:MAG TPA: peptidoglycan DD-metalloendopeptidase family protein [Cellulomonas sp.]